MAGNGEGARVLILPALPINLSHHNIQRADDGRHIGDQATAAKFVRNRQIAEATAARSCSPGDRTAITDDVKAHLPARGFGF